MDWLRGLFVQLGLDTWLSGFLPRWGFDLVVMLVFIAAIIGALLLCVMALTYLERKFVARVADRLGPNRTGPWGILQPLADTLKLLIKEDIAPAQADRWLHFLAPAVVVTAALLAYAVIPFGAGGWGARISVGLLYVLSTTSLMVIGILMAGWGSHNKYSLLGGLRVVVQILSYEVPMVLALLGPVLLAGTMDLAGIAEAQRSVWFVFTQPVAALIYLIAGVAETNRAPFDLPEAESELVAGFHLEYGGVKFAFFFMAEYINMVTVGAVLTTVFLGGWYGPLFPGPWWVLIKIGLVLFLYFWFRSTFPRMRLDQWMNLAWKVLVPLALVHVLLTALVDKVIVTSPWHALSLGAVSLATGGIALALLSQRVARRQRVGVQGIEAR